MARQAGLSPVDRRILALAVPALGTLAADPLLSLVDTAFVSRLGTVPLAALGVDTALFSFAFFAFNFLAYATTPMVARRLGAGDDTGAGRVVAQAVYLALGLGVVTATALIVFAPGLVRLMQASGEVVEPAGVERLVQVRGVALAYLGACEKRRRVGLHPAHPPSQGLPPPFIQSPKHFLPTLPLPLEGFSSRIGPIRYGSQPRQGE